MSEEQVIEAGLNAGRMVERAELLTILSSELEKLVVEMTVPLDQRKMGYVDGLMFVVKLLTDRTSK